MHVNIPEMVVLGGAAYALFSGLKYALRIQASLSWPSTTGKIICSDVEGGWEKQSTGRGLSFSYMYKPVVRYEYFVDGQRCEGDEVSYFSYSYSIESLVKNPQKKFPAGKEIEVFYNPKNPADSLLASARPPFYFLLLPLLFSTGLLVLVLTGVVRRLFS